jgi:Rrf2 family protein
VRVSAKTEYACIAMMELASSYGSGEPVRIRKIAEDHGIPARFLVQILLQLKGAGFVTSTRGAAGGYQLAKDPAEISLGEVMTVIEGSREATPASAPSNSPAARALADVWNEITAVEEKLLRQTSFADLVKRAASHVHQMYYI